MALKFLSIHGKKLLGVAIFLLPTVDVRALASQTEMAEFIERPTYLGTQQLTWTVPASGITISAPIYVSGNLTIKGSGQITIENSGRFIVEKNAALNLQGVSMFVTGLTDMNDKDERKVILLKGGHLSIEHSKVVVDVPFSAEKVHTETPWDEPPRYWFVGVSAGARMLHTPVSVLIENSQFDSKQNYSAGAFYLSNRPTNSPLTKESMKTAHLTGIIRNNQLRGFHGAITVDGGAGFEISSNALTKNTFTNVVFAGRDFKVTDNRILYPGDGTTGDGMTILGALIDSTVSGNTIYGGSCYGVWVHASHTRNILFTENTIANGITSAIYVSDLSAAGGADVQGLKVINNIMTGNAGFAVAIEAGHGIEISDNSFEGNAPGFPAQLMMSGNAGNVSVSGNLSSHKLTPEWATEHALYRHATFDDNQMFVFHEVQGEPSTPDGFNAEAQGGAPALVVTPQENLMEQPAKPAKATPVTALDESREADPDSQSAHTVANASVNSSARPSL